ncbi:hypothetical protein QBC45DRAFT_464875 [Copromyces sp. CBS 386.78]|nr:hypothetical protein QBC45DRAFT_464875 [Copromyces sp. CBS 386.78]
MGADAPNPRTFSRFSLECHQPYRASPTLLAPTATEISMSSLPTSALTQQIYIPKTLAHELLLTSAFSPQPQPSFLAVEQYTNEELAAWIAERRANWPSKAKVAAKKAAVKAQKADAKAADEKFLARAQASVHLPAQSKRTARLHCRTLSPQCGSSVATTLPVTQLDSMSA